MARRSVASGHSRMGRPSIEERARRRFPEAGDQRGQRGLAAAGGPDDGERGAGGNVQVDVVQAPVSAAAIRTSRRQLRPAPCAVVG